MRRRSLKPDFSISGVKPYRYGIRAVARCSLAVNYAAIGPNPLASGCLQHYQSIRELTMKGDCPSASPALRRFVMKRYGVGEPAGRVGYHRPGQLSDLFDAQPGLETQQDHYPIPLRMSRMRNMIKKALQLGFAQRLCLFTLADNPAPSVS